MTLLIIVLLSLLAVACGVTMLFARMRLLDSAVQTNTALPDVNRYKPMLRLLSEDDFSLAGSNSVLRNKIGTRRRELFRGYLRCLTKDYAALLNGIRRLMVESGVDRPDLAKALAKNRVLFALALCRIEINLQLHALGVGKVDVSGLVNALDVLRNTVSVMTPATGAAY